MKNFLHKKEFVFFNALKDIKVKIKYIFRLNQILERGDPKLCQKCSNICENCDVNYKCLKCLTGYFMDLND